MKNFRFFTRPFAYSDKLMRSIYVLRIFQHFCFPRRILTKSVLSPVL